MPLRQLSNILWRERELVDLVEQGASDRVSLQLIELERAMVVDALVGEFALDHDVTLRELVSRFPEPWPDVFGCLHNWLTEADTDMLPRSLVDFLG